MSCCEVCVVRLTQLVGMGLRHGHTSKEPGDRTGGPQDLPTHHHPATTPMASMLVVGWCSWFSFAFSFKTELSPWELVRRTLAGGRAQGTWPIL